MSDSPLTWNINESIPIRLFVIDPNTGLGLTGQTGFISLTIQRESDSLYWNGSAWISGLFTLTFSETDSVNSPGLYTFVLSAGANNIASRYSVHAKVNNPPLLVGESYEMYVSKDSIVRLYEAEPA